MIVCRRVFECDVDAVDEYADAHVAGQCDLGVFIDEYYAVVDEFGAALLLPRRVLQGRQSDDTSVDDLAAVCHLVRLDQRAYGGRVGEVSVIGVEHGPVVDQVDALQLISAGVERLSLGDLDGADVGDVVRHRDEVIAGVAQCGAQCGAV